MTNIATLLETAIAQALPDNWQQEPETHLPALSLIISNILLPNCCQMSNLNSLAALIEESAVSENRLQLQIQFRCFYPYSDIIIHQLADLNIAGSTQQSVGISKIQFFFQH